MSLFCRPYLDVFLKLLAVFVGHLGSFSFFLSAVLEAFCCYCRPSWKLFTVAVGRLGNFSLFLTAVLEASRSFCQPYWNLLAVLDRCSRCFVLGHFLAAFVGLLVVL